MTNYLWYSPEREKKRDADWRDSRPRVTRDPDQPEFCVYGDSTGEPVRVTLVSSSPDHQSGFKDIELIDVVSEARCIAVDGTLQQAGIEFCAKRNLALNFNSVAEYMRERANSLELTRRLTVRGPLRFKT